jgi:hypothetical protein
MESYYRKQNEYENHSMIASANAETGLKADSDNVKRIYSMINFFELYIKKAARQVSEAV